MYNYIHVVSLCVCVRVSTWQGVPVLLWQPLHACASQFISVSLSLLINIPKYAPNSVVISGTWTGGADNIQRPKGYVKEYPHGLVRYSSSILGSWTSHWLLMASKHHGHSVFPVHPGIPFFDAFIIRWETRSRTHTLDTSYSVKYDTHFPKRWLLFTI